MLQDIFKRNGNGIKILESFQLKREKEEKVEKRKRRSDYNLIIY